MLSLTKKEHVWRSPHEVISNSGTNGSMCLSVLAEIERFFTGLSLFIYYQNRETITIGTTNLLPKEVEDLVRRMGLDYTGCSYHLIDRYILHVQLNPDYSKR